MESLVYIFFKSLDIDCRVKSKDQLDYWEFNFSIFVSRNIQVKFRINLEIL